MNLSQVLNALHTHNAGQAARLQKSVQADAADSSSASTAGSDGISSTDFMTLLVSELKNQDPTSNTDPNTYVDQLVQVNSLQQLISINQGITSLGQPVTATGSEAAAAQLAASRHPHTTA